MTPSALFPRPPRRSSTAYRALAACVALTACVALAACQAPPAPPPPVGDLELPDGLEATFEHHVGSLLTGPSAGAPAPAASGRAVELRCALTYLEALPRTDLEPLASETLLVATPRSGQPLANAARLAGGALRAEGAAALELLGSIADGTWGRTRAAEDFAAELLPGTTVAFELHSVETFEDKDNFLGEWRQLGPTPRRLGVHVSMDAAGTLELALALEGLAPGGLESTGDEASEDGGNAVPRAERLRPDAPRPRYELVVPARGPQRDANPYVLVVPSPFESGEGAAFAIALEVEAVEASGSGALEQLVEAAEQARRGATQQTPQDAGRRALRYALAAVAGAVAAAPGDEADGAEGARAEEARGPLSFLAARTDAQLASDVVLLVDRARLARYASWTSRGVSGGAHAAIDEDLPGLGWRLERNAFQLLATEQLEGELPASLEAALLRHAGEVGRYPSLVNDLLAASVDLAAFRDLLAAENAFFLEDSNPASRVRAFDWLAARGLAPEGYDPLAPRDARRAALEAARAPAEVVEQAP